ncbi:isocitrate lyase/PEP mutase family protein [Streptomyces sp. TP-A0874]|uniref:isocitrate lyase/PEP mutase family protein n=1 Tax=Streptomyces sp. TP-A0874 TaxID=549819 RepID=UPI000853D191|nr:isocitrate lyase/phosphoenolpyruvate mutase family protein [Streptomyces sp. TP-A0874]
MPPSQADKAHLLRSLHQGTELLRLLNVWDVASARAVASRPGTTAIATASAAIAAVHGHEDGEQIPLDLHLAAVRRICAAVSLPVTADLERGYGDVGATIEAAVDAGAVGANLEDAMAPCEAFARDIREAVAAGASTAVPLFVNARTDVYLAAEALDEDERRTEAMARGLAYLEAGADCVFVPGLVDEASIRELAAAFGPGRLSLLARPGLPTAPRLQELGVARLSHGPALLHHAMAAIADYDR